MAKADKVKIVVDNALRKVGEYSDRASDKAADLAERAAEKAGELSEAARGKAPSYVDRAADLAERAAEATAAGVDKATGGRFHDKIDSAHGKVDETLHRVRTPEPAASPKDPDPETSGSLFTTTSAGTTTVHPSAATSPVDEVPQPAGPAAPSPEPTVPSAAQSPFAAHPDPGGSDWPTSDPEPSIGS